MADIDALTLDVEDMVYGLPQVERPVEDTLATAVSNASDVSWQWSNPSLHARGDLWEYVTSDGSIGEIIKEAESTLAEGDVTVRRAQERTSAASSFSAGDVFRKNPQFPRVKIQRFLNEIIDGLYPDVWIRTNRTIDLNAGRSYYPANANDFEVEEAYQADISSEAVDSFTYDESGGVADDVWENTGHGLTVGEAVRFTAAGGGATGYAANTVYWVAAVPDADHITLAATEGGSAIEGTDDSTGVWSLERVFFQFDPLPPDSFKIVTDLDNRTSGTTGRVLRVFNRYSDDATYYYVAKTKPSSSSVSDIPAVMADFIPYGAVWLLMGGTRVVPARVDPMRSTPGNVSPAQPMADSRFFRDEFDRRKAEYRRQLEADKYPSNYLRRNAVVRR